MPSRVHDAGLKPSVLKQLSAGNTPAPDDAFPHVLLIVDGFPESLGGGERVVLRMAALLPVFGFRVSILTFSIHPRSSFQPSASPCPLYLLPLTKTYNLEALRGALALRQLIRTTKVQLVQTFFESSDLWAGMVVRGLTSARLVWSRRDMGILRGKKHTAAYRLLRRMPHSVHAVSEQVRLHAIHVDGVAPERTKTIHNGLALKAPDAGARRSNYSTSVVVTIGNIRQVKGHDVLVRAAALVHAQLPEVQFVIAGEVLDQNFFKRLCALVETLGLADVVTFTGGIKDPSSLLNSSDVFVLPSRSEGFSNSLIEAMASGLPTIATDVGGNAEAIQQGTTGFLVPSENHEALATALLELLQSARKRDDMGCAARLRAAEHFSAHAMMQKISASYHDLLR